jgi:nicotinamidase/pyrazinamidase
MKIVFVDVDTQIDFLYPAGALYVPGGETIVERLSALNCYAASSGFTVISTMDAHTEDDPEFKLWPHHCVVGTAGQRKPACTLAENRLTVPNGLCELALDGVQQILLEKQTLDCFSNVNLPVLLERLGAERYVVYGVVTEICVKLAAFGLLKTGKPVELVTDAVRGLSEKEAAKTLAEFTAGGGALTTVARIVHEPIGR